MSTYLDHLQWRYATKKFDATKKISESDLQDLLSAARLSASSYGLQPYKILVVTNPELRAKLGAAAYGQTQVTDASHLIVLCTRKKIDEAYVDQYVAHVAAERGMPVENLKQYRDMMAGAVNGLSPEALQTWNAKQTYIVLGFLLSAAAQMEIDSCPMEGFDAIKFDEILGLDKEGLTATVLCPVGYRAADDATAAYKKVRLPESEIFETRA